MNYAVELELGAMISLPNFVKIGLEIQKLIGGYTCRQTQKTHR
jgi:hypothetical protein